MYLSLKIKFTFFPDKIVENLINLHIIFMKSHNFWFEIKIKNKYFFISFFSQG